MELFIIINHKNTQIKCESSKTLETSSMQTRSSKETSTDQQPAQTSAKQLRYQSLLSSLKAKPAIQKAKLDAKNAKKREEKRLQKLQFAAQKQQLKSRCLNTTTLNFVGDYVESDEQVKIRLHSHLLTGRLSNKSLQAFALEVSKRLQMSEDNATARFRVPHNLFKRAARKATELLFKSLPKSILKHRLSELEIANADTAVQRQIRALKRSE